jgi:F-type H+-transporting ATPase subunit epsilon
MNLFKLSIVTPDGVVFEATVEYIVAPGVNGEFTVMAGHTPLVAATNSGVLKVVNNQSKEQFFAIGESLVEVTKEQTVVLANQAGPCPTREDAANQAELFVRDSSAPAPKE